MEWITFRCPGCQQGLKIGAAKAGRKVKCTRCGAVLTVPAAAKEAPAGDDRPTAPAEVPAPSRDSPEEKETSAYDLDADAAPTASAPKGQRPRRPVPEEKDKVTEDEPTPPKARLRRQREPREEEERESNEDRGPRRAADLASRWRKVSLGLLLLLVPSFLAIGSSPLIVILTQVSPDTLVKGLAKLMPILPILSPVLAVVYLTAYGLCSFVPARNAARAFAVAGMVLTVLSVVVAIVQQPISSELLKITEKTQTDMKAFQADMEAFQDRYSRLLKWYGIVAQMLVYAQTIVGTLFLRAVAQALKAQDLAANCLNLLKFSVSVLLFAVAGQLLLPLLLSLLVHLKNIQLMGYVGKSYSIILALLTLASGVWQVLVLIGVRAAIRDHLEET